MNNMQALYNNLYGKFKKIYIIKNNKVYEVHGSLCDCEKCFLKNSNENKSKI